MPAQRWMRWVFCDKRSEKRKRPTAPSSLMFEALSERASPMSMTGTGSSPSNAEGFNRLRSLAPATWPTSYLAKPRFRGFRQIAFFPTEAPNRGFPRP